MSAPTSPPRVADLSSPAFNRAFAAVQALVDDYAAYAPRYESPGYQEAEARADFINKFLIALGWDVHHETQRNPYAQEVSVERGVNDEGRNRRADYAFFVAPDFQKERLIIEAKKPSLSLANADYYFQAIKYAWPMGHPLVVLTSFRELHIIDSRAKPVIETVLSRRLAAYTWQDYADAEKFAEIYYLLARDEVAHNSLDTYAQRFTDHLGKKTPRVKAQTKKFDDEFLESLDDYREQLARAFKKENPDLDGETLTEIVQRTLDRLVFMRFLEDKQIVQDTQIDKFGLPGKTGNAWRDFIAQCAQLEKIYNGVVFKSLPALDEADYSNAAPVFTRICEDLSGPYSPYDFSRIPIHILGSIYERFLGKIIRATPKQAKVETKEEVRKAGGVYYTPEYIVRYIVKHTVGECIRGKAPQEIAPLRFADIACGSGSFLLGVFDELLDYHRQWFAAHPAIAKKQGCVQVDDGRWRLPLHIKREILLNNIYGVDIDAQAVEVAQLSLYLKLLEEETTQSAYQYTLDHHDKLLPMLSRNIVCGNSLVGRDIQDELFDDGVLRRFNAMDFEDAFPMVMRAGGFDAIVGNPPYVRQESLGATFKAYAALHFETYTSTADLYAYFIERAHRKLKPGGAFGYIVSNKFMRAHYGRKLRDFLANKTTLRQIIDFGELPVFAQAAAFPSLVLTRNQSGAKQKFLHAAVKRLDFESLDKEVRRIGRTLDRSAVSGDNWSLASRNHTKLLNTIQLKGIPLGEYIEGKIYYGIKTGLNEAFVIDAQTRQHLLRQDRKCAPLIKPFALGDDVRHYALRDKARYLICMPCGWTRAKAGRHAGWPWFAKNYPALAAHLAPFEKRAKARSDQGDFWWELRPCDYYKAFEQPKIVWPDIAKASRFTLDLSGRYLANTAYIMPVDDKVLLAILNSKLIFVYFKSIATVLGDADKGGRLRWIRQDVVRIPIAPCDPHSLEGKAAREHITTLVTRMLAAKQQEAKAITDKDRNYYARECTALDRQIDEAVYALYGLDASEIALIEADWSAQERAP
jgi:type I restriction-modification system DNA methylase subunit